MNHWSKQSILFISLLMLFGLSSCPGDSGKNNKNEEENIQVTWSPCSLEEGAEDGLAECGTAQIPLFWEADDGRTLTVGVKRWLAGRTGSAQLWLIQGGPGASGTMTFAPFMQVLREAMPDVDLYTIDHRGVGSSSHLTCPNQEAEESEGGAYIYTSEWNDCIDWLEENLGDTLQAYSTTNAAHDLAAFIEATREEGKPVFVWGGSYGTYLTQRYLLLHPDQADGAILDSIHSINIPAIEFSLWRNENGKALLQRCSDDPVCMEQFGISAWRTLNDLYRKFELGHCSDLQVDKYLTSYLLGWLAWYSPYNAAVPALIYRLDRCTYADMLAVVYMWDNLFNGTGDLLGITGGWWSQVLNANIAFSDSYWSDEYDDVDMEAYFTELMDEVLIGDISTMEGYEFYRRWPRYDEPRANELPATDIPVLMLQGALDGSTPLGQADILGQTLVGGHQHYLVFPNSAHGVINDSWVSEYFETTTCGLTILADFIEDPTMSLDVSCIDETLPVDFAGVPGLAAYIFGTADLWENSAVKGATPPKGSSIRPLSKPRFLFQP